MSALRWRYAPIIARHVPKKKMPFHFIFSLTSCHKSVRNVPTLSLHWRFHPILLGRGCRSSPPHHRLLSRALGNQCQTKRNHEGEMLMPNGENRKVFLHSRKSKHTFPFSVLSFSARSFQTQGIFRQFRRTFSKFRRRFSKFQGKKTEKCPTKLRKQHVVSSQTSTSFEKTPHNPAKTSENHDFQSR